MAKKAFDLEAYKKTISVADTPLKPDKFVIVDECLQEVIGLPGWPLGHITMCPGKSDTGKTSLLFDGAAKAQQQGILPVIIVTEGKVDWSRAAEMGFDKDKAIINENCEFIEDVFDFMDRIITDVSSGDIPHDVMIFFDSIGNTLSKKEVEVRPDGTTERKSTMMVLAKSISEGMRILSKKINDTRKVSYPKSVGLFIVNQVYTAPPAFYGGPSVVTPVGGTAVFYRSSLVVKTSRTKKLSATKDGITYGFGIVSKITVDKNHISSTTNSGEFVITADKIIPNEKTAIENYKKDHKDTWGEELELVEEV